MSTPSSLTSDAINLTLSPGAAARMVTEYMPPDPGARVINTATTGTVYLGTSSSVQPSNGVPLPAGSSVQWVNEGQLWAIAGPDATGPILLVATSCISSWEPSPETVALTVAAQLLATGIPNVFLQDVLYDQVLPLAGTATLNVSGYSSLIVVITPNVPTKPAPVGWYRFHSTAGPPADIDTGVLSADVAGTDPVAWSLPVTGAQFDLIMATGGATQVTIYGTNRPMPRALMSSYRPARQLSVTKPNLTASGNNTQLVGIDGSGIMANPNLTSYNGPIDVLWTISSVAGTSNNLLYVHYLRLDGTPVNGVVGSSNAVGTLQLTIGHPYAHCSWYVQNFGALTAAQTNTIIVVPHVPSS